MTHRHHVDGLRRELAQRDVRLPEPHELTVPVNVTSSLLAGARLADHLHDPAAFPRLEEIPEIALAVSDIGATLMFRVHLVGIRDLDALPRFRAELGVLPGLVELNGLDLDSLPPEAALADFRRAMGPCDLALRQLSPLANGQWMADPDWPHSFATKLAEYVRAGAISHFFADSGPGPVILQRTIGCLWSLSRLDRPPGLGVPRIAPRTTELAALLAAFPTLSLVTASAPPGRLDPRAEGDSIELVGRLLAAAA